MVQKIEDGNEKPFLWEWVPWRIIKRIQPYFDLFGYQFGRYQWEAFYNVKMDPKLSNCSRKKFLKIIQKASIVDLDNTTYPALIKKFWWCHSLLIVTWQQPFLP